MVNIYFKMKESNIYRCFDTTAYCKKNKYIYEIGLIKEDICQICVTDLVKQGIGLTQLLHTREYFVETKYIQYDYLLKNPNDLLFYDLDNRLMKRLFNEHEMEYLKLLKTCL